MSPAREPCEALRHFVRAVSPVLGLLGTVLALTTALFPSAHHPSYPGPTLAAPAPLTPFIG
jgi:hypothetical protein